MRNSTVSDSYFLTCYWIPSQEHLCTDLCQMMGICYVDTTPHSIESTFIGRHESFEYTKVWNNITLLPITYLSVTIVLSRGSSPSLCGSYTPERAEAFRTPCPFHNPRHIPFLQFSVWILRVLLYAPLWSLTTRTLDIPRLYVECGLVCIRRA